MKVNVVSSELSANPAAFGSIFRFTFDIVPDNEVEALEIALLGGECGRRYFMLPLSDSIVVRDRNHFQCLMGDIEQEIRKSMNVPGEKKLDMGQVGHALMTAKRR